MVNSAFTVLNDQWWILGFGFALCMVCGAWCVWHVRIEWYMP